MPIDTSIYGMVRPPQQAEGPLDQYGKALQLRHLLDSGELSAMQRQQLQRQMAEEDAVRAAFSGLQPGQTIKDILPDVMRASPKAGFEFQSKITAQEKAEAERKKTEAETPKIKAETLAKNMGILRDVAAQVSDDAGLAVLRNMTAQLIGPEQAARIPATYSPDVVRRLVTTADQLVEQLKPKYELANLGGTSRVVQLNPNAPGATVGDIMRTATPGEVMTNARQVEQNADTRARGWASLNQPVWDSERGVFVPRPGAGGGGSGGAPAAAIVPPGLPARSGDVQSLRKEFNDLPEVKNYRAVVPVFNSALKAPDTRAGDIQLAYTIGKIFDPNSVVREGELKLVGEAATVMEKFLGELRTVVEGKGRLTPQTRRELVETAQARALELEAAQKAARATYEQTAKAKNLPLNEIFVEMPKLGELPPPKGGKSASRIKFLGME